MPEIDRSLQQIKQIIAQTEIQAGREPGSVALLAVSKRHSTEAIHAAWQAGQRLFGESYLQEASEKIAALADLAIEWHYIGPIQSNKTRDIAQLFSWVHSVDRPRIAERLSNQRPASLPVLNICIQVNISGEPSKSGVLPAQVNELAALVSGLPRLRLRGLMAIPAAADTLPAQREPFHRLHELFVNLQDRYPELDTLSMGMSNDMQAAILEGSTLVRIGTGLFGHVPENGSISPGMVDLAKTAHIGAIAF